MCAMRVRLERHLEKRAVAIIDRALPETRTAFDGAPNSFDGMSVAGKLDVWHSPSALAITTLGLEATPPLGRQDRWELEPANVSFPKMTPSEEGDRVRGPVVALVRHVGTSHG